MFLSLAALMAIACTITYIKTGSLWVPVAIHWLTVLAWVFLLSGRNCVLDIVP
jgi:predicted Abi (CAAX) family protease